MRTVQGVLIADVIHSSRRKNLSALLADGMRRANRVHLHKKRIRVPYAVTAGDEFQTVVTSIEMVPHLIFDLRRRMRPLFTSGVSARESAMRGLALPSAARAGIGSRIATQEKGYQLP